MHITRQETKCKPAGQKKKKKKHFRWAWRGCFRLRQEQGSLNSPDSMPELYMISNCPPRRPRALRLQLLKHSIHLALRLCYIESLLSLSLRCSSIELLITPHHSSQVASFRRTLYRVRILLAHSRPPNRYSQPPLAKLTFSQCGYYR